MKSKKRCCPKCNSQNLIISLPGIFHYDGTVVYECMSEADPCPEDSVRCSSCDWSGEDQELKEIE